MKCDKCKKIMEKSYSTIVYMGPLKFGDDECKEISLCPDCSKKFKSWLNVGIYDSNKFQKYGEKYELSKGITDEILNMEPATFFEDLEKKKKDKLDIMLYHSIYRERCWIGNTMEAMLDDLLNNSCANILKARCVGETSIERMVKFLLEKGVLVERS